MVHLGGDTQYAPQGNVPHSRAMRYLVQFLIPALIFLGVVYIVTKKKRAQTGDDDPNNTFLVILVIGAVVAVAVLFATPAYW